MNKKTESMIQNVEQQNQTLMATVGDVARMLHVSIRQVWRLHSIGKLPNPVRLGSCVRWRVDEIRAFVEAGCPCRQKWESQYQQGGSDD